MTLPSPTTTTKRLLSGMQPSGTGRLHLGNWEGALKPWVRLQDEYEMFCFVADLHALTSLVGSGESIADKSRQVVLDYLSAGLDPARCAIFKQSDVFQHAELHTLLSMVTPVSWLERVPTYKEKREHQEQSEGGGGEVGASYGLLGYPNLQAADILVYRAHAVPVGKDQAAHLELTREIARRFNHLYGTDYFPEPDAVISEATGVLPGLDADADGKLRKMSKSYGNTIQLSDGPDDVAKKLKGAFTSPLKLRKDDPGVPEGCAVCQLRRLYDPSGYEPQWNECRSGARGCLQSKRETTDIINAVLDPLRARRAEFEQEPALVDEILAHGAERARDVAEETMRGVRTIMKII